MATTMKPEAGHRGYVSIATHEAALAELRDELAHEAGRAALAEVAQNYWIDACEQIQQDLEDGRVITMTAFWVRFTLGVGGAALIFFILGHMAGRGVFGG